MYKKPLRFICALAIVLVLSPAAWAKNTAQLDYLDIALRVPKENKQMDILQRRLPLAQEMLSDAADANRYAESMAGNIRQLSQAYSNAIDTLTQANPSDPNIAAMQALQGSLGLSQMSLGSIDMDTIKLQVEQLRIAITQSEASYINAGQRLFVTYHQLQDSMRDLRAKRGLLEESLSLAKTQLNAGLGTALAVKQAELSIAELDTGLKQMDIQAANLLNQLKLIVGWPQGQIIKLGDIPRPNREFLGKIKLADDIKTAQTASYSMKTKQTEYKYTDEGTQKTLIKLEIEKLSEEIALGVATQHYKLQEVNNALLLEEQRLAVAEEKIKQARLQHQLGLLADIALQSEESAYTAQKDAVATAMDTLFWEIENYKAILAGLS